jgi:hypothetical protein
MASEVPEVKEEGPIILTVSLTSREAREVRWALQRTWHEWRDIRRGQQANPERYTDGQKQVAQESERKAHGLYVKFFEEGWDDNGK